MRFDSYMIKDLDGSDSMDDNRGSVKPSNKDANMIRKSILEKMDVINDYIERAESCENDTLRKLFLDIAEEERVHFGELEMFLEAVDPLRGHNEDMLDQDENY